MVSAPYVASAPTSASPAPTASRSTRRRLRPRFAISADSAPPPVSTSYSCGVRELILMTTSSRLQELQELRFVPRLPGSEMGALIPHEERSARPIQKHAR